jgi:ATP-dependent Clp endopeptidase proteolytic subunit ClpP
MRLRRIFNDTGERSEKIRDLLKRRRPSNRSDQWYRFENVANDDTAHVYIYDEIGYWGNTASEFVAEIKAVTASNIVLHVNSPGGDVFDGMAIMNAIRNHPATVRAEVDGVAASAASFIIQGADRIIMQPGSQLMIHDAQGIAYGNAADLRELADELDRCSDDIAGIYASRAGGTKEAWRKKMLATTWYSAEEAVEEGLADEVLDVPKRKGAPCNVAKIDLRACISTAREQLQPPRVDSDLVVAGVQVAANDRPAWGSPIPERTPDGADLRTAILKGVGR